MAPDTQKKFLYSFIGQRLRALREENGLTQAETAALIGKSHQTYSNYEKADNLITLDSLYILARFYKVSVRKLLPEGDLLFGNAGEADAPHTAVHFSESAEPFTTTPLTAHSLAQAEAMNGLFLTIKSSAIREQVLALVRTIAAETD